MHRITQSALKSTVVRVSSFVANSKRWTSITRSISSTRPICHFLDNHRTPDNSEYPPKTKQGVALIVGAGDALGSALALKFAKEGLIACVVRRNAEKLQELKLQIESSHNSPTKENSTTTAQEQQQPLRCETFPTDARNEGQMQQVVETIESDIGPIEVAVHNIGANVRYSILDPDMTSNKYFKVWEMAALSAFHVGKAVATKMKVRGKGTVIFTGATASIRGGSHFSAFSGAMFAKRALAQSMARELGPQGIHVAHVIIDGGMQTAFVKQIIGEEKYYQAVKNDALLTPEAVAENYWHIHQQPRVAWTHELDLRPWVEQMAKLWENMNIKPTQVVQSWTIESNYRTAMIIQSFLLKKLPTTSTAEVK